MPRTLLRKLDAKKVTQVAPSLKVTEPILNEPTVRARQMETDW